MRHYIVDGCYSFWQGGSFPLMSLSIQATLAALPSMPKAAAAATLDATTGGAAASEGDRAAGTASGGTGGGAGGEGETVRGAVGAGSAACQMFCDASAVPGATDGAGVNIGTPPFSSRALQGWLLLCCQLPNGGAEVQARP